MIEKIITLFLLLGSITYLFEAHKLTFGTFESPKSGFLPLLVGCIGVLLALASILSQMYRKQTKLQPRVDWAKFIFVVIGLLFYITFLNTIGYITTTFIFLFYLFKVADTEGWIVPLSITVGSSAVFYLLFERYLGVVLP